MKDEIEYVWNDKFSLGAMTDASTSSLESERSRLDRRRASGSVHFSRVNSIFHKNLMSAKRSSGTPLEPAKSCAANAEAGAPSRASRLPDITLRFRRRSTAAPHCGTTQNNARFPTSDAAVSARVPTPASPTSFDVKDELISNLTSFDPDEAQPCARRAFWAHT
mmetsp:Transcript_6535/g.17507  ORF Transcript_6535/g.17507 Transcript_6535/m.17507 type:complete len:164 (+) Transcript_6535:345-836(+)|eukprot:CAMPEP_0185832494 /NCGR_PEP_ID=MMETSP1353-20130828/2116_1 /TAXON_ID=1077150 /ORGANISM="Erythrolobus australicus, Strain CCMP3124" /LENGTH=163 /DNA_ID=CAMNT_0028530671 /DNA_START=264 /DNA_END=755 /DNA_ORIENTATION=+